MLELSSEIITLIEEDATIINLMETTSEDTRIYAWNPSEDVVYSNSKKSAIFYKITYGKRPPRWTFPKQFGNATLFLKTVSIEQTLVNQIAERLVTIFDISSNVTDPWKVIETTNWKILKSELLSHMDAEAKGSGSDLQWSKMTTFMFSNVLKR